MTRRRARTPVAAITALLVLGALVAWGVGGALGLRFERAAIPVERPVVAEVGASAPVGIASIAVPVSPRLTLAATALADAIAGRDQPRPVIGAEGPADLVVLVDEAVPAGAYRLDEPLVLTGGDDSGAAAGLYALADRVRSGRPLVPAEQKGNVVKPRLGLRLTDAGSVGREPDVAAFAAGTDYSLNTDIVGGALLPRAPWVDQIAVERISRQFHQFVEHALAQGYNGVVLPGFLEYITFSRVGDGYTVYDRNDAHVARAQALIAAFAPVFRYAADMGMKVYLLTDMLALSPPLERYLDKTYGGLNVEDPKFWRVYALGLAELFERMPFVSGLMIRIGEGGAVYKQAGWDYESRIAVTTPQAVRTMLAALLEAAGEAGRDIIFRTWTVGVGAVGRLHTDPEAYDEVLGGVDNAHLIVSTKYTLGDFYSHLPFNSTLEKGPQRRIVEFQSRREFEGFGSLPNDLTGLHQQALQRFLAANPHIEGVWTWTQDGGPLRAGPMTLLLRSGFWQLYDLNSYALGRLAWDPATPAAQITADWARRTYSDDPATVAAVCRVMAMSREAITKGLYLGPYADDKVEALGLEPPPMMWIFEWDIVTGDSAALDSIYAVSRDHIDQTIAEGDRAVALAASMRETLVATDPATWRDATLRAKLLDALAYETDLFRTLGAYRTMVLRHAQWLDTGSPAARAAWEAAETKYRQARTAHVDRYGGDVDLPAYNFTAADLGAARADRDPLMSILARVLLGLVVLLLLVGLVGRSTGLRALWLGATSPWRLADLSPLPSRLDRVVVIAVPAVALILSRLVYTWFAAPAHLVVSLGGWLLFALTARLVAGRRDPFHLWAAMGGVALLRTAILLAALILRGPGGYWFAFWTDPVRRSLYITVAFAAFAWLFVAVALVLRDRYALPLRRTASVLLAGAGVPLVLLGGLMAVLGLERSLTIWNDQMALLPWGLSRILGITVYLGIPTFLPLAAVILGAVLLTTATALLFRRPRHAAPRPTPSLPAGPTGQQRPTPDTRASTPSDPEPTQAITLPPLPTRRRPLALPSHLPPAPPPTGSDENPTPPPRRPRHAL
ncbi:hypothetical protein [Dactylosporangium matsuzakiense]|uniref:hypothetical protein n=1 Tax=Dactylosporangium matsuzakiense TaxID=53360 RepID=UPI0021C2CFD8|nr:hypothetical protein [Dactylosporangium matsuzakiense]